MTDHDELRRLAEAATPAYRLVQGECANPALAIDWYDGEVVVFWPGSFNDRPDEDVLAWRMDAEFIAAADPQTVLGLLDEIDRLRERQESADLANEGIRLKRRAIKAERERDELRAKVERVREMHRDEVRCPHASHLCADPGFEGSTCPDAGLFCRTCDDQPYPCATIRALDGDTDD